MTFIAQTEDGPVAPEEAATGDRLACVECADSLSIVSSHTRTDGVFVSRHFRHPPDDACGGGESDTHKAMKSIALSKLKETYPDHSETSLDEKTVGDRKPDAYLRFDEPHDRLGYGVVAEAQYRNHDKDTETVTENYLNEGFSVYWLDEDDYDGLDVSLGQPVSVWKQLPESTLWDIDNFELRILQRQIRHESDGIETDIILPRDWFEDNRDELKAAHITGRGEFDLCYRLGANNATRRCSGCGGDAMAYLFTEDYVSRFVCAECFPDSEQPRAEVLE
jgi:hypothetical protein